MRSVSPALRCPSRTCVYMMWCGIKETLMQMEKLRRYFWTLHYAGATRLIWYDIFACSGVTYAVLTRESGPGRPFLSAGHIHHSTVWLSSRSDPRLEWWSCWWSRWAEKASACPSLTGGDWHLAIHAPLMHKHMYTVHAKLFLVCAGAPYCIVF